MYSNVSLCLSSVSCREMIPDIKTPLVEQNLFSQLQILTMNVLSVICNIIQAVHPVHLYSCLPLVYSLFLLGVSLLFIGYNNSRKYYVLSFNISFIKISPTSQLVSFILSLRRYTGLQLRCLLLQFQQTMFLSISGVTLV